MSAMRIGVWFCLPLLSWASLSLGVQPAAPAPDSIGVIAGAVVDALSHKPLRGVNVVVENTNRGSDTDTAGHFSVRLTPGRYRLVAGAWGYVPVGESAEVFANLTTPLDFRLLPQRYVNDSVLASFARVRMRELQGSDTYRRPKPEQVAFNNPIRMDAWKTFLSGKGTYGIKKTITTVEGDPIYQYLIVENGKCRMIEDTRNDALGPHIVSDRHIARLLLTQGRRLAPDSTHYVGIPFDDTLPTDEVLRFEFLDDAGHIFGMGY
jgi:hypothetical protein